MILQGNPSSRHRSNLKALEPVGKLRWFFTAIDNDNAVALEPVGKGNLIYQEGIEDDDMVRRSYISVRILTGLSSTLRKAVTGAPLLSTPKAGKDWEYLPSKNTEVAKSFEATTVP